VRHALDALTRADLVIGPYGSDLVRAAGAWAAKLGRVLWNHGGSADDVESLSGVVSVASPASSYLAAMLDALARHQPSARVLVAVGRGGFGHHAAQGARHAAARLGMSFLRSVTHDEVPASPDADVLLLAGGFEQDLELLRRLRRRPAVIGAVAAGRGAFANELGGRIEGVLAPTQWEEGVRFGVDLGPLDGTGAARAAGPGVATLSLGLGASHIEYPNVQAYRSSTRWPRPKPPKRAATSHQCATRASSWRVAQDLRETWVGAPPRENATPPARRPATYDDATSFPSSRLSPRFSIGGRVTCTD
jgi:hypothetical protein